MKFEHLNKHNLDEFDCGVRELNEWFQQKAKINESSNVSRTYLLTDQQKIIGFVSLAAASAEREQLPSRQSVGISRQPSPLVLIARLAVDKRYQRQNFGKYLLERAIEIALEVARLVGVRSVQVEAKNKSVARWYQQVASFAPSEVNPLVHYLLIKDAKRSFGL